MTDCVYFFIVFGFTQTQPHAFNKLLTIIYVYLRGVTSQSLRCVVFR